MLSDPTLKIMKLGDTSFNKWDGVGKSKLFLVNTMEEWKTFYSLLEGEDLVACDTETTGFEWYAKDHIVGLSFGWRDMHFYVPCRHEESVQDGAPPEQIDFLVIKEDLIKFFSKPTRMTLWHNAKFDMHFYAKEGVNITCKIHDTSTMWKLFDENAPGALKTIASGWKDSMGRWRKGVVDGAANLKETQIGEWRTKESRLRRDSFRKIVMAEADLLEKDFKYQHLKRNELKKLIASTLLKDHKYANSGKEFIHYGLIPVWLMTEYAALDTFLTYKVYEYCVKNITWTPGITALYKNEMQLLLALFEAEEHGMRVDRNALEVAGVELQAQIDALDIKIRGILGDCNLRSLPQLIAALQAHGVELTKYTESTEDLDDDDEDKKYALDKKVLEKLKHKHDVVKDILELRAYAKTKGTYVDGILSKLNSDNVLHCSFNQNVSTGRMSSNNPNLQNIPAKDKTIRKAFIPWDSDFLFVFADYSQIEIRLIADHSQDPLLLDAYAKNQDIHTRTFCEMFGFDINFVTPILKDENHPRNREFSLLRGVAKCVSPETLVYADGKYTTMSELGRYGEEDTFTPLGKSVYSSKGVSHNAKELFNGGTKQLVTVVSRRGVLTCSENHRFSMLDGSLVRAIDLKKGMRLAEVDVPALHATTQNPEVSVSTKGYPNTWTKTSPDLAYLAGAFTGDGSASEKAACLTHGELGKVDSYGVSYTSWQDSLFSSAEQVGFSPVRRTESVYLGSVQTLSYLKDLGLLLNESVDHSRKTFLVPAWIRDGGREYLLQFFGGLFDTDGTVGKNRPLSFTTKSAALAGHAAVLLKSLGVQISVEPSYNKTYNKYYYRLTVKATDCGIFVPYLRHVGKQAAALEKSKGAHKGMKPDEVMLVLSAGEGPCVDLHMDSEDHLYCANGFSTHNTINFGIIYGVGAPGLSEQIKRPDQYKDLDEAEWVAQCQSFIDKYLDTYIGVKRFINQSKRAVKKDKQVTNCFGRVRHLPHIDAVKIMQDEELYWMQGKASRQGPNFEIQGGAADLFKIAIVRIRNILKGKKSKLVNFVHDEVQLYMHKTELDLLPAIKRAMEDWKFSVPIIAEFSSSETSWGDKKSLVVIA